LNHPAKSGGSSSDEALQRARIALRNQRPDEAERFARDFLQGNPSHKQAVNILGYALLMQQRADDAIAVLEPAARTLRDAEIDTQLALALRQAGRDEDAVARFKRATKRQPPFPPAFYELGILLHAMKRSEEAIEVLTAGLAAGPMPELSDQIGHIFLSMKDYASAKSAFAKTLAITLAMAPHAASALWGMGKACQGLGEHKSAIDYFRRCLAQAPNDAGTLLNLGHCLLETGELNEGCKCFRAAARGDENRYAAALATLVKSSQGRFWLRPSAARKFLRDESV